MRTSLALLLLVTACSSSSHRKKSARPDDAAPPDAAPVADAAPPPPDAAPPPSDAAPPDAAPPPMDDTPPDAAVECSGDERQVQKVFHGTREPTYLPLAPGQIEAVGSFDGCSGLLIAPTWVLTAKHCELDTTAEFCLGADPDRPEHCLRAARVVSHPRGDLSLVELPADARTVLPDVQPVPILEEDLDGGWIGRTAEAGGYGQLENGGFNRRRFTAEPIVALDGDMLTVDGQGRHGLCFGDSGGPVMVVASDGTVRTAGALTDGDGSCVGEDNFTRVDTYRDWIERYAGPPTVDAGCGEVDAQGRCLGQRAIWCDGGQIHAEDCTTCGWDAGQSAFRCIAGPDPCGGHDAFGDCDGQVARWCEGGQPKSRDCGSCGEACDLVAASGGADCVVDPCHGLDYDGRCDGDVAEWCEDGQPMVLDCAAQGQRCGWVDADTGYYCE
jgi:hypothetical protein